MNMHCAGRTINTPIAINSLAIDKIDAKKWIKLENVLNEAEKKAAGEFFFEADRRSYIAAHGLLRLTLSDWTMIDPKSWRFEKLKNGKPVLFESTSSRDLRFNITHARSMVAVALADGVDVGVDVEPLETSSVYDCGIAERYFAADEANILAQAANESERQNLFLKIWSLKEAILKSTGQGITQNLNCFSVIFDPVTHSPLTLSSAERVLPSDRLADREGWSLHYWLHEGHHLSLGVYKTPGSPKRESLCVPLLNQI